MVWLMVWSKARTMRQMSMGWLVVPNRGRVLERVYSGLDAGMVYVKGVALGSVMARSTC